MFISKNILQTSRKYLWRRNGLSTQQSPPPPPIFTSDPKKTPIIERMVSRLLVSACDVDQWEPKLFHQYSTTGLPQAGSYNDPFKVVQNDLQKMNENIKRLVRNEHPVLSEIANYYFDLPGKRFRPLIVLLLSQAIQHHHHSSPDCAEYQYCGASDRHLQLAQIIEMIHAASIIHDDVIDDATLRRTQPSINAKFSNKMAILGGDFLLAKASVALAKLGSHRVTELMSNTIAELVEGEMMNLKQINPLSFSNYMKKTYLKTASLIENACTSAAELCDDAEPSTIKAASTFGKNLGMAFQFVDDLLDFTSTTSTLGKPAHADLSLGLATGPVLFALSEHPNLAPLIERRFKGPGDVEAATKMVKESSAFEKQKELAIKHCEDARVAIQHLASSPPRNALIYILNAMVDREK